jgi:hypothetical protein
MQGWDSRRWTGVVGFVWVVIQVVGVVLFLAAGNPPDFGDAKKFTGWISSNSGLFMMDAFLTGIGAVPLLALFAGVRSIIRAQGDGWEWAAGLFYGGGVAAVVVLMVGAAAEATSAFISGTGTEPTAVRASWAANQMLLTFVYFPGVVVTGMVAYVAFRTGMLPRWIAWLSSVATALIFIAGLTIFGGTGSYGPVSVTPIVLGALPVFVWVAAVSAVLVGRVTSPVHRPLSGAAPTRA